MNAGRMPAADALRIAAATADQLRQMHDQGQAHGALTPSVILIGEAGVELQPAPPALTPYTAPEILAGRPADQRTDVFSFGAILYEMMTGRRAFEGSDEASIMLSLAGASPLPSGSTALDQLVHGCVAKSADGRFQRMQKVQLELRLLTSASRRGLPMAAVAAASATPAAAVAAPLPKPAPPAAPVRPAVSPAPFAAAVPAPAPLPAAPAGEIQALEARMSARLEQQDQVLASFQQVATEVLAALRGGTLAAPPRQPLRSSSAMLMESEGSYGRMDRAFELLNDKVARIDLAVGNAVERLLKLEQQLDEFDTDAAALRDSVTRDVRNFERALKAQSAAIESARTAMGQTDDLVERVVEALDSLQSMFMVSAEEQRVAAS
jgi:hypothetical protein